MNTKQQPEALRLADTVERYNAGVHSQAIVEDYAAAARELRRQHDRIVELEEMLRREVQHSAGLLVVPNAPLYDPRDVAFSARCRADIDKAKKSVV